MPPRGIRRRSLALLVALSLAATGCEAMIPYHWHSAEVDDERFAMVIEPAADAAPLQVVMPRDGVHPTLRVSPLLFQTRFESLLSHNVITQPRAPAMWGARATGEFFAEPPKLTDSSPRGTHGALFEVRPGVHGFRLQRWLKDQLATELEFSIEPRPEACLVTLERIHVVDCRAKVADKSWVNFWSRVPLIYGFWFDGQAACGMGYGDNAVDMHVDLAFLGTWSDASGEARSAPLAVLGWSVPDVPIGKVLEVHQAAGWLPWVPHSANLGAPDGSVYGRGLFVVEGFVTEQDDLSPAYIADRATLGQYLDDVMGLVGPGPPVP